MIVLSRRSIDNAAKNIELTAGWQTAGIESPIDCIKEKNK